MKYSTVCSVEVFHSLNVRFLVTVFESCTSFGGSVSFTVYSTVNNSLVHMTLTGKYRKKHKVDFLLSTLSM